MSSNSKWLTGSLILNAVLIIAAVLFFTIPGANGSGPSDDEDKEVAKLTGPAAEQLTKLTKKFHDFNYALLVNKDNSIVPVLNNGTMLKPCAIKGKMNDCRLFKEKVQLEFFESMSFMRYKINPNCVTVVINGFIYEICT